MAYLKRQNLRRAKKREELRQERLKKRAAALVAAARRQEAAKWRAQADEATQRKNQVFRQNRKLQVQLQHLKDHSAAQDDELKALRAKLADASAARRAAEQAAQQKATALHKWELWWGWVRVKAKAGLVQHVLRLGRRPPPPSRDRGWGGGQ